MRGDNLPRRHDVDPNTNQTTFGIDGMLETSTCSFVCPSHGILCDLPLHLPFLFPFQLYTGTPIAGWHAALE